MLLCFVLLLRPPPTSTLFPYTTLFRSHPSRAAGRHESLRRGKFTPNAWVDRPHPLPVGGRLRGAQGSRRLSGPLLRPAQDRKSTRLNSSHTVISYAVFCLKKKKDKKNT